VTTFLHHAADAALPVALMLLAATVVARLTLELPEATPDWRRAAATYLEPLSAWTFAALAVRAVAQFLGGGLGGLSIVLLLMLAAGVMLLRTAVPAALVTEQAPAAAPAHAPTPPPAAEPLRPTDGALWAGRRADDAADRRAGLWQA
jgi:hypothetical protein